MGDGPEIPGQWESTEPSEPPAALLRRAISHVESLLHRLDPVGEVTPDAGAYPTPAVTPAAEPGLHADAAAESDRILLAAREQSERMHAEARDRASDLLTAARHEAAAIIDAAIAEADRLRQAALDHRTDHAADEAEPAAAVELPSAAQDLVPSTDSTDATVMRPRRPLGLLFGAQRG